MTQFLLFFTFLFVALVPAHYAQLLLMFEKHQQHYQPPQALAIEVPKAYFSPDDNFAAFQVVNEENSIANTLVRKKRCNGQNGGGFGGNFPGFGNGGITIPGIGGTGGGGTGGGGTGGGGNGGGTGASGGSGTANSPGRFGGRIGQWGRQAFNQFTGRNSGGGSGGGSQFSPGRSGGRQQGGRSNSGGSSGGSWGFGK